jgi:hypothetical protein
MPIIALISREVFASSIHVEKADFVDRKKLRKVGLKLYPGAITLS